MIEQEGEPKKKTQEGKKRSSETENHKKQCLATLKRLKRGANNELERNLGLEKVVASKQLRLAMETEEERRARLQLPIISGQSHSEKLATMFIVKLDVLTT